MEDADDENFTVQIIINGITKSYACDADLEQFYELLEETSQGTRKRALELIGE